MPYWLITNPLQLICYEFDRDIIVLQFMKKFMVARDGIEPTASKAQLKKMADEAKRERTGRLQEMAMEVAADDDQPFPAPYPQK